MNKMRVDGNRFYITQKKRFNASGPIQKEIVEDCFNFAYDMTFGGEGRHRDHRTGGGHNRKNGEIFINAFQGKLAEFCVYSELDQLGINCSEPSLETWGLGQWDDTDLTINDLLINIKSTKFFGNLLLLEAQDWDENGNYLPDNKKYDFFMAVRIKPSGENLMKNNRVFYSENIETEKLEKIIFYASNWFYDIPGFITNEELIYAVRNDFVIPQGALLNGKIPMDAENYYIQFGDFHPIDKIFMYLS